MNAKAKLVLVAGLPGSGKSYFARHLAQELSARYISSDQTRKSMGLSGHYDEKSKQKVYDRLYHLADEALKEGRSVIVDATFHRKERRKAFEELAKQHKALFLLVLIKADEALIRERLEKPRPDSEAGFEVYEKIKREFEDIEPDHLFIASGKNNLAAMLQEAKNYIEHKSSM